MLICFGQEGNFFCLALAALALTLALDFILALDLVKVCILTFYDIVTLYFCAILGRLFEWSAMSVLGRANLKYLTNQLSENNINVRTQVKISTDDSLEEVSRESILLQDGYFRSPVTDYNMDKVNYPENTLFYINWLFKTVIS